MIYITRDESGITGIFDDANGNVPAGAEAVELACDLLQILRFEWLSVVDGELRYSPAPASPEVTELPM